MKYTAEIEVDWAINGYKLMFCFVLLYTGCLQLTTASAVV